MEIIAITKTHPLWETARRFAAESGWPGGAFLAKQMEEDRFLPWERVFVVCEGGALCGFCSFTQYDEMPERYGYSPFIGCVYVDPSRRGNRLSEKMLLAASRYAKTLGYESVYLMSGEQGLYEKYGFQKLGEFATIFGTLESLFAKSTKDTD